MVEIMKWGRVVWMWKLLKCYWKIYYQCLHFIINLSFSVRLLDPSILHPFLSLDFSRVTLSRPWPLLSLSSWAISWWGGGRFCLHCCRCCVVSGCLLLTVLKTLCKGKCRWAVGGCLLSLQESSLHMVLAPRCSCSEEGQKNILSSVAYIHIIPVIIPVLLRLAAASYDPEAQDV